MVLEGKEGVKPRGRGCYIAKHHHLAVIVCPARRRRWWWWWWLEEKKEKPKVKEEEATCRVSGKKPQNVDPGAGRTCIYIHTLFNLLLLRLLIRAVGQLAKEITSMLSLCVYNDKTIEKNTQPPHWQIYIGERRKCVQHQRFFLSSQPSWMSTVVSSFIWQHKKPLVHFLYTRRGEKRTPTTTIFTKKNLRVPIAICER